MASRSTRGELHRGVVGEDFQLLVGEQLAGEDDARASHVLACEGLEKVETLRISINTKVTWIPRESVDRLVARVCVDGIRNASE